MSAELSLQRKTRSHSRIVSASNGDSAPGSPHILSETATAYMSDASTAVLKASSMEPLPPRRGVADRKPRHKMTDQQLKRLEELYQADTHPSREDKEILAKEVGMGLKSVLIWFQNRRQDRRRKKTAGGSPVKGRNSTSASKAKSTQSPAVNAHPKPASPSRSNRPKITVKVPPVSKVSSATTKAPARLSDVTLHFVDQSDDSAMDIDTSPNSIRADLLHRARPTPHSSSSSDTLDSARRSRPHRDAKHNKGKLSARTSQDSDLAADGLQAHPTPGTSGLATPQPLSDSNSANVFNSAANRPNLEWACAHSAARRRHGLFVYRDEDDSGGEASEFESELGLGERGRRRTKRKRAIGVQDIAVPREYHALFSPDVVLGASLLLTLKYSEEML